MSTVRGHFRRTSSGQQIWIKSYQRGKSKDVDITKTLSSPPLAFSIRFKRQTGNLDALVNIVESQDVGRSIVNAVSSILLNELKNQADKFSQTGKLVDSFYINWVGSSDAEIVSDLPYAKTWTKANNQGSSSAQSIRDWMEMVDSFDSKSPKEMRYISWSIRQSVATGVGAGSTGLSTLRKLDPVGERYFDYVSAAIRQIEPVVMGLGAALSNL